MTASWFTEFHTALGLAGATSASAGLLIRRLSQLHVAKDLQPGRVELRFDPLPPLGATQEQLNLDAACVQREV